MNEDEEDEMKGISGGLLTADLEQWQREHSKREKTCLICYVDFENGEKVMDVPNCLHTFHEQCLAYWLKRNILCPVCLRLVKKPDLRPRESENAQQDLENGRDLGA